MKLTHLFPVLIVSSFLLAGCGNSNSTSKPTPTKKPTPTVVPTATPTISPDQFVSDLGSKANLKFNPVRPSSINWKKGTETTNVSSQAAYVQDPKDGDAIAIRNQLIAQGYTANSDNTISSTFTSTDAFAKENRVCLIIKKLGTSGALVNTKIDCANLPIPKPTK